MEIDISSRNLSGRHQEIIEQRRESRVSNISQQSAKKPVPKKTLGTPKTATTAEETRFYLETKAALVISAKEAAAKQEAMKKKQVQ